MNLSIDETLDHPGIQGPMEGIEVPADGTMAEIVVEDPDLPEAPPIEEETP